MDEMEKLIGSLVQEVRLSLRLPPDPFIEPELGAIMEKRITAFIQQKLELAVKVEDSEIDHRWAVVSRPIQLKRKPK